MNPKKILFVVNPHAARGRLKKQWPLLADHLRARVKPFDVEITSGSEDATKITRKALEKGFQTIIAVGGDGTLNECLNGFVEDDKPLNPRAVLGTLPMGRGGDFARFLKISSNPESALFYVLGKKTIEADIGKVLFDAKKASRKGKNYRYFINIASIGIVGNIVNQVNMAPQFLNAHLSYLYSTLRGIWEYQPKTVTLIINGQKHKLKVLMITIANGRYFGSGMNVAPGSSMTDGLFNVALVPQMPLSRMILDLSKLYSGDYLKSPRVLSFKTHRLQVIPENVRETLLVEMDGDTVGRIPATFEVIPKAIRLKSGC